MTEIISMEDFNNSKKDAVNLSDDEKFEADMETAIAKAGELFDFITETTDADPEVLYFIWSHASHVLVNVLGWTRQELQEEIGQVDVCLGDEGA